MSAQSTDTVLLATCAGGLEDVLEAELTRRGWEVTGRAPGAVRFRGPQTAVAESNITLRTASRVLLPVTAGAVASYDELYRLVSRADWHTLIPPGFSIGVTAISTDRRLADQRFATLRVKDAIVDAQKRRAGKRSNVAGRKADVGIVAHVSGGQAEISLDTTGKPLHARGYRTEAGAAPLRETVAAGMILMSGWAPPDRLVDPFCGSGTIAIEAALIAAGIHPGSGRDDFAFLRWPNADRAAFDKVRGRLCAPSTAKGPGKEQNRPAARIRAYDVDADILDVARRNAARAGVSEQISFELADFFNLDQIGQNDVVVTNPPYGERMGLQDAPDFSRRLGDHLKQRCAGAVAWILSANLQAMKRIGLRTSAKLPLFNGGLESRLYRIDLY